MAPMRPGREPAVPSLPAGAGQAAIELVVFDWDGTLIDSTAPIVDALCLTATDLGLPPPSREQARQVVGLGLAQAIRHIAPSASGEQLAAFIDGCRARFAVLNDELRPFAGIVDLLEDLHALGVPLAVATGMSRSGLDRALARLNWVSLFAGTRCGDEGIPKPDAWMLRDLCDTLGVAPSRAVMIGDTTHDLGMAAAAGAPGVAVSYGAHRREALAAGQPAALVDEVAQLRAWLWPRLVAAGRDLPPGSHWRAVCVSADLKEGGDGVRFDAAPPGAGAPGTTARRPAFVVRHEGLPRAYLNECAHVPVELDWPAGRFFDHSGLYLVCATHGATYRAADGSCAGGPCRGRGLTPLKTRESNGRVWVAFETRDA